MIEVEHVQLLQKERPHSVCVLDMQFPPLDYECTQIVSYYAFSVIKMGDGRPHTENQQLCHDCRFHVTS